MKYRIEKHEAFLLIGVILMLIGMILIYIDERADLIESDNTVTPVEVMP